MARIWVWQEEQAEDFFAEARRVLRARGVLALPTETFYALAVNPFDAAALARLFALKDAAGGQAGAGADRRAGDALPGGPGGAGGGHAG